MEPQEKLKLALVVDPRFSGGTSSAVAREIRVLAPRVNLSLHALETKMFKGRDIHPLLQSAAEDNGLSFEWNPNSIRAEIVAFHNPSCLKFDETLPTRIICDRAFVVTHENFLRPGGSEGYDVGKTLAILEKSLLCRARYLAPVSTYNRRGVQAFVDRYNARWALADFDWFNICDFETVPPVDIPRDRRGRLSRPGFEKFPSLSVMERHFPAHAEACHILGGDSFLLEPATIPDHWTVLPFGAVPVSEFLTRIDFFIYFTHPQWRESFGRVIAEAVAAGKIVITDPGTAEIFGSAVVASNGDDVDGIIADFIAEPDRYRERVLLAQQHLLSFGSTAFGHDVLSGIRQTKGANHDLL